VLRRILGRVRNLLTFPDGHTTWPVFGDWKFNDVAPVRQYQFVQKTREEIEVRLVAPRPVSPNEEQGLTRIIHEHLGYPFRLVFTYHDEIPRDAGGKYEDFKSEIGLRPGPPGPGGGDRRDRPEAEVADPLPTASSERLPRPGRIARAGIKLGLGPGPSPAMRTAAHARPSAPGRRVAGIGSSTSRPERRRRAQLAPTREIRAFGFAGQAPFARSIRRSTVNNSFTSATRGSGRDLGRKARGKKFREPIFFLQSRAISPITRLTDV
jgi:hypothetical protein